MRKERTDKITAIIFAGAFVVACGILLWLRFTNAAATENTPPTTSAASYVQEEKPTTPQYYYLLTTAQVEDAAIKAFIKNQIQEVSYSWAKKTFDKSVRDYFSRDPNDKDALVKFFWIESGLSDAKFQNSSESEMRAQILECEFFAKSFCDKYGYDSKSTDTSAGGYVGFNLKNAEDAFRENNYSSISRGLFLALGRSHVLTRGGE
jgi:hypothetical protein